MSRVTTCATGPYSVSYHTSSAFAGVYLNSRLHNNDEPNEFGGHGTSTPHPVHDGQWFATMAEAQAYAFDVGLTKVYTHTPTEAK
ncbi:MAG: hypothetical protein QF652_06190 [Dehalococcoidia bacterium]|jgi:hypothetical protein|nr:hypothetical protein [Dehalococcoidia bacterium]